MLQPDQIQAMAPDPSSLNAGRKLALPRHWQQLGCDSSALWGLCQGSTLYQVQVCRTDWANKCSCPSRKFPCKHVLGLLLLAADQASSFSLSEPPAWVSEWLDRREKRAEAKASKPEKPKTPSPKKLEERQELMSEGLRQLEDWFNDLACQGLAAHEANFRADALARATRLVDAKLGGIASRLRVLATELNPVSQPREAIHELSQLAFVAHLWKHFAESEAPIRNDLNQYLGLTASQDEVASTGEQLEDRWYFLAQSLTQEGKIRTQRTWLKGEKSGRLALILRYAINDGPFQDPLPPLSNFQATLAFYPSAFPLRALFIRHEVLPIQQPPESLSWPNAEAMALDFAAALGTLPLLNQIGGLLRQVSPVLDGESCWLVDQNQRAIPFTANHGWPLICHSLGRPVDIAGEWDGRLFHTSGFWSQERFIRLDEGAKV